MNLYQIIAFSEAGRKVCFVEYHCCPAGVPDTPEEAVKYALKWHTELGISKYKDVQFWVKTISLSDWQQVIIDGIGKQEPGTVAFEFTAAIPDKPFIPAFSINDELSPEPSQEKYETTDWREFSQRDNPAINHEAKIPESKPRNKGGRPRKNRK